MALEEVGTKLVTEGESQFLSTMKKAEDATSGFGKVLGKVAEGIAQGFGQQLFNAVSAGIGAIPNLMKGAVDATMEWGQGLDNIGDILGTTTEESAGLQTMFQTIGGSSEQLTGAMAKMSAGLLDAKGQLGPTGQALKGLGIEFKDAKGKMLPATAIFQKVADKLGNMPDGLEKTSMMMDIFGKSGKEMGDALAAASNGGMELYIKKAKDMGLVLDPQDIIDQQMAAKTLDLAFKGIEITLGKALLPVMEKVTYGLVHMLADPDVKAGIQFISDGILALGEIFGNVFEEIRAGDPKQALEDLFVGFSEILPESVLPVFDTFVGIVYGTIDFFEANWPIISATFQQVGDTINGVIDWIKGFIKTALDAIQGWWSTNGTAIISSVTTMWERVKGLFDAASRFIQALIGAALKVLEAFWQTHGDTIMAIVQWLWDTVQAIFNTAISVVTSIFNAFTALLQGDWDGFVAYLLQAWETLWVAIKTAAEAAWDKLSNWLSGVMKEIIAKFNNIDWGQIGRNIMDGIGGALRNGWNYLTTLVSNLANELFEAAKKALGIASPSKLFENIGINMMLGMGKGISDGSAVPIQATQQAAMSSAAVVSAGPSNYQYSYATNYNLNLTTQQSAQPVQQSFAIMRMLAG